MAKFTITIDDQLLLGGLTAAREALRIEGVDTDAAFVQRLVEDSAVSYVRQYGVEDALVNDVLARAKAAKVTGAGELLAKRTVTVE